MNQINIAEDGIGESQGRAHGPKEAQPNARIVDPHMGAGSRCFRRKFNSADVSASEHS